LTDVYRYDEKEVEQKIKELPIEVRLHLSHIIRNGLCLIYSAYKLRNSDIEKEITKLQEKIASIGL